LGGTQKVNYKYGMKFQGGREPSKKTVNKLKKTSLLGKIHQAGEAPGEKEESMSRMHDLMSEGELLRKGRDKYRGPIALWNVYTYNEKSKDVLTKRGGKWRCGAKRVFDVAASVHPSRGGGQIAGTGECSVGSKIVKGGKTKYIRARGRGKIR